MKEWTPDEDIIVANGFVQNGRTSVETYNRRNKLLSNWNYSTDEENKDLDESLSVRKWEDTEWHNPTREYLGLED